MSAREYDRVSREIFYVQLGLTIPQSREFVKLEEQLQSGNAPNNIDDFTQFVAENLQRILPYWQTSQEAFIWLTGNYPLMHDVDFHEIIEQAVFQHRQPVN